MAKQILASPATTREPIRVEYIHAAPVVHVHEAPALLVTDRNCKASAGLELRAWRKVARTMGDAGFATTTTADGVTALRADVESWLRTRAPRLPIETGKPAEMSDSDMLATMTGVKR